MPADGSVEVRWTDNPPRWISIGYTDDSGTTVRWRREDLPPGADRFRDSYHLAPGTYWLRLEYGRADRIRSIRRRVELPSSGPYVLLLDEPTNHLDVDAREALVEGLNAYGGALILVSHDRHLIEATVDQLWLVEGGTCAQFFGDMEDYQARLLAARASLRQAARRVAGAGDADLRPSRKDARRSAAEIRALLDRGYDLYLLSGDVQPKVDAAARALGASGLRIMFRHLLPNVMAPIIVTATRT